MTGLTPFTRMIQVRSNSLILYDQLEYLYGRSAKSELKMLLNLQKAKEKSYSGLMCVGTQKRISRCIDLLVQISKPSYIYNPVTHRMHRHQLSFITLTVSAFIDLSIREVYKKCFEPFMQWMRRTKKVESYVWKAELQHRGIIHYHITTPTWIDYQIIKDKWNNLQRSAGIIELYRAKQLVWHRNGYRSRPELFKHWPLKQQKIAYERGMASNWNDPNSTDIHEVRKVKDLSNYLKKEFCKTIQATNEPGKVWDCSINLKRHKYFKFEESLYHNERISELIDSGKVSPVCCDSCIVIRMKDRDISQICNLKDLQGYDTFLNSIRNYKKNRIIQKSKS